MSTMSESRELSWIAYRWTAVKISFLPIAESEIPQYIFVRKASERNCVAILEIGKKRDVCNVALPTLFGIAGVSSVDFSIIRRCGGPNTRLIWRSLRCYYRLVIYFLSSAETTRQTSLRDFRWWAYCKVRNQSHTWSCLSMMSLYSERLDNILNFIRQKPTRQRRVVNPDF